MIIGKCEVHYSLKLHEMEIVDRGSSPSEPFAIQINSPQKSFVVCAEDQKDKESWIQQIKKSSEEANKLGGKRVRAPTDLAPLWKPDSHAEECHLCKKSFSFVNRRHHCRSCGSVICGMCSTHRYLLTRIHAKKESRVCDTCWGQLQAIEHDTEGPPSSKTTQDTRKSAMLENSSSSSSIPPSSSWSGQPSSLPGSNSFTTNNNRKN